MKRWRILRPLPVEGAEGIEVGAVLDEAPEQSWSRQGLVPLKHPKTGAVFGVFTVGRRREAAEATGE